jgi:hypothetical protein
MENKNTKKNMRRTKAPEVIKGAGSAFPNHTLPNGIRLKFTEESIKNLWINAGEIM